MRTAMVECKDKRTARRRCPWAAVIVKVFGGWYAFESVDDYKTWWGQR